MAQTEQLAVNEQQQHLTKEIKCSLILIAFAIWILYESAQYPINNSWGGVENVWYISPALFPLFIGFSLVILAVVQLYHALTQKRKLRQPYLANVSNDNLSVEFAQQKSLKAQWQNRSQSTRDTLALIAMFISYIYCLIPNIDFAISTWFFLACLTSRFYLADAKLLHKKLNYYLASVSVLVIGLNIWQPYHTEAARLFAGDVIALPILGFTLFNIWTHLQSRKLTAKRNAMLLSVIILPFVTMLAFKYLLLVPMPTESSILLLIDTLYYEVLGW